MVVCNDCFAYIFGFFFGKTPLIRLSPKKTWEGFMGGFIMTLIWSFWFAGVLQGYNFMTCPKVGFSMDLGNCDMEASPLAEMYRLYPLASFLPAEWASTLPGFLTTFQLSSLQVHALVMAVFASLVAPFGGFFASGFKRAFKIKDFGDTIPGHEGFTDRMDCQIIMGLFVYVYITHVVGIPGSAVSKLFSKVTSLPPRTRGCASVKRARLFAFCYVTHLLSDWPRNSALSTNRSTATQTADRTPLAAATHVHACEEMPRCHRALWLPQGMARHFPGCLCKQRTNMLAR